MFFGKMGVMMIELKNVFIIFNKGMVIENLVLKGLLLIVG